LRIRDKAKELRLDHQHCLGTCQMNDAAVSSGVSWQVHSFEKDTVMKTNKQVYPAKGKWGYVAMNPSFVICHLLIYSWSITYTVFITGDVIVSTTVEECSSIGWLYIILSMITDIYILLTWSTSASFKIHIYTKWFSHASLKWKRNRNKVSNMQYRSIYYLSQKNPKKHARQPRMRSIWARNGRQ